MKMIAPNSRARKEGKERRGGGNEGYHDAVDALS